MVEEATPQAETLYAKSALFLDRIYLKPKGPRRKVLKKSAAAGGLFHRFAFLKGFTKEAKEMPLYVTEDIRPAYGRVKREKAPLSLEGPAGKREIIFKPAPPTVPRGLYGEAKEYRVRLKFFVSNDGMVYDLKPIVSSGYPDIDLRTIRFLKRWRFSPLSVVEKEKGAAWGTVTVRLEKK
jgi:TonB family protein